MQVLEQVRQVKQKPWKIKSQKYQMNLYVLTQITFEAHFHL